MRSPKPLSHPYAEAFGYIIVAVLALMVIGHEGKIRLPSDVHVGASR